MAHKAPGKAHREGISLIELGEMFPDEEAARVWFESTVWPSGRHCPRCGSTRTHEASHAKMRYRCTDCRSYFSARPAPSWRVPAFHSASGSSPSISKRPASRACRA